MSIMKTIKGNKRWQGCGAKGTLVGMPEGAATVGASPEGPQGIKDRTHGPEIPTLSPKETQPLSRIDICFPLFTAASFITAKICRLPKCPVSDECMRTMCVTVY